MALVCFYCGCTKEESEQKEITCIVSKNGKHKFLRTNQREGMNKKHKERFA